MGVNLEIGARIIRVPIFFFVLVWYNRIGDKMNILITGASSGIGYEMAEKKIAINYTKFVANIK